MNAKTRQPRGNETQGRRVVVGRIVFSFNAQVLKVIDLDEASMKSDKKIEIVKSELGKLVKENKIKDSEKYDVGVDTERFPPTTFLSSTHSNSNLVLN